VVHEFLYLFLLRRCKLTCYGKDAFEQFIVLGEVRRFWPVAGYENSVRRMAMVISKPFLQ
jgi:hypothetical protein